MMHPVSSDLSPALTPELAALDAELASLQIRERASFGPELEMELVRRMAEMEAPTFARRLGRRVAVGGGSLLLVALVFSPARASLSDFIQSLLSSAPAAAMEAGPMPPEPKAALARGGDEPPLPPG